VLRGVEAQLASKNSKISINGRIGLMRIRPQRAIYFWLHRLKFAGKHRKMASFESAAFQWGLMQTELAHRPSTVKRGAQFEQTRQASLSLGE